MLLCLSLCDMVTKDKIVQFELQNMPGCGRLPAGSGAWWSSVQAVPLNTPGFGLCIVTSKRELEEMT